jgi:Fur family transcriptional regulator, ferric uptake regulator
VPIIRTVTPDAPAPPQQNGTVEQFLSTLRSHGGRATAARRILLDILLASHQHRSAEDLAAAVHARAPDIALTTIYRNLDELERLAIIDRTRQDHGPATYHLAAAAHGHLECEQCGQVTEIPADMFHDLAQALLDRYGFQIHPRRFAVLGLCPACRSTPGPAGPLPCGL